MGVLFRAGDQLAVVQNALGSNGDRFKSCGFQLSNGHIGRTAGDCQTFEGFVVGFESRALWALDDRFSTWAKEVLIRLEWNGVWFAGGGFVSIPETLTIDYSQQL